MSEFINGYIVVRRPDHNFDFEKRAFFPHLAPRIGDICYSGLDRLRWNEIEEGYYKDLLPSEILALWNSVRSENNDLTGLTICESFETAKHLLDFSNREEHVNELIVINSAELSRVKGGTFQAKATIEWLGYDPFALGYWSLLKEGIFVTQESFSEYYQKLNEFGLFPGKKDALIYSKMYEKASLRNAVEELPTAYENVILVKVGRVVNPIEP